MDLIPHRNTGKPMKNYGTHCLHLELDPIRNPGQQTADKYHLEGTNEDIRALFNITNQLATQVQVQNIILHLRAMLVNLRDCLHFMKQLANHLLEYIDTATTGTLTPHLIPVSDLQQMLYQIELELPPNMHLPIPSSDPLHFYRYLWTHVLVEENQFLLLIDIPIQDRAQ